MTRPFNFRDVLNHCGIHLGDNEVNWAVGHMLRELAAEHGIEPERNLTEKTNPNPSVAAPHCIAHYPSTLFIEACQRVNEWWGYRQRQLDMFK